jgi:hypothetical protein
MESITQIRLSSSGTDAHGLPIIEQTEITLDAIVATRQSSNNTLFTADAVTILDGLTIYLASGTDVQDNDLFVVRGKRYAIDGEAFDWRDGLGNWNPGTVVNLTRETNGQ